MVRTGRAVWAIGTFGCLTPDGLAAAWDVCGGGRGTEQTNGPTPMSPVEPTGPMENKRKKAAALENGDDYGCRKPTGAPASGSAPQNPTAPNAQVGQPEAPGPGDASFVIDFASGKIMD